MVAVQLAAVLLIGLPVVAITSPFVPDAVAALGLAAALVALAFVFWRSTANLHGHVRAASQVIVQAIARQGATPDDNHDAAHALLHGLGDPVVITIGDGSVVVGRTLADIAVRGLTGATVLALARDGATIPVDPHDPLRAGDALAVSGTAESIAAARALLADCKSGAPAA